MGHFFSASSRRNSSPPDSSKRLNLEFVLAYNLVWHKLTISQNIFGVRASERSWWGESSPRSRWRSEKEVGQMMKLSERTFDSGSHAYQTSWALAAVRSVGIVGKLGCV
jgi:hypothetical protein